MDTEERSTEGTPLRVPSPLSICRNIAPHRPIEAVPEGEAECERDLTIVQAVGLSVYETEDGWVAWGLAADTGLSLTGAVVQCAAAKAYQEGFEALLALPWFHHGLVVDIYCADETFTEAVLSVASAWPYLMFHEWSETAAKAGLRRAARNAAKAAVVGVLPPPEEVQEPRQKIWPQQAQDPRPVTEIAAERRAHRRRVVAATDGSRGGLRGHKMSTFGWVTDEGKYGRGTTKGPILVAELAAIVDLLGHVNWTIPMEVLVDSQDALRYVDLLQKGADHETLSPPRGLAASLNRWRVLMATLSNLLCERDVRFTWVHGHSGNVLNDIADRIALATRRNIQMGLSPTVLPGVLQQIVCSSLPAWTDEHRLSA